MRAVLIEKIRNERNEEILKTTSLSGLEEIRRSIDELCGRNGIVSGDGHEQERNAVRRKAGKKQER
jgi:hypothetical protein